MDEEKAGMVIMRHDAKVTASGSVFANSATWADPFGRKRYGSVMITSARHDR